MTWQDITLMTLNIFFGYALIPQVYYGFKSKTKHITLQTALITTLALYTQTFVFFTLQLTLTTIASSTIAFLWTLLLIQTIIYK